MDIEFTLNGIRFVADEVKMARNPDKHSGVTFQQAVEAFFDPFLRIVDASPDEEARDAIIGMDKSSRLLYVVHIVKEEGMIRLISTRKATRTERRFYEAI